MTKIKVDERQFKSPRWRLSNLYTITDKQGKAVKFKPNSAQLAFMDEMHEKNILLKARQLGFTTFCCLIYLDASLFVPNTRAGVIAHRLDDAKTIFRDKIKFPFDNLDAGLRAELEAKQDSADTLTLSNNSSIRVSTSMRSGTLQYLHVSEFGKLCAQFPERAREVITGSLNTVAPGEFVVIESTAEGQEGRFYEMCQKSKLQREAGLPLTSMDYKFHFFPWYEDKGCALPAPEGWRPPQELDEYFSELAAEHDIVLSADQYYWYTKKDEEMGGDMKREYPATPEEAFEQALEGAYFAKEIEIATRQRRIGRFPFDSRAPVNTFWDLGRNDFNTVWFHQKIDGFDRFIHYYENSGEFIGHYVNYVRQFAVQNNLMLGEHYWPHDGDRQSLWLQDGTLGVASDLGFRPGIVQRPDNKVEAINTGRTRFSRCQFDEVGCSQGIKRLKSYRKEWDDVRGVWKDRPRHDDASHGADGFLTFACCDVDLPEFVSAMSEDDLERERAEYELAHNTRNATTGY